MGGNSAREELREILDSLETAQTRHAKVLGEMAEALKQVPNADKLLTIPGLGTATVGTFIAEVGDISRFKSPKQLQKLAGLEIMSSSDSGQHIGQQRITHRGRRRLRKVLYQMAMNVIMNSAEFNEVHKYFTGRESNRLTGMQSVIAVSCKLIRVAFAILIRGTDYDGKKMLSDIRRPEKKKQVTA